MHAFAQNYNGQTVHGAIWKWAHEGHGPRIVVRNNRFLAFDAPVLGGLLPYVNRVASCQNNVLLFAGTEAEWAQALSEGCDDQGDDGNQYLGGQPAGGHESCPPGRGVNRMPMIAHAGGRVNATSRNLSLAALDIPERAITLGCRSLIYVLSIVRRCSGQKADI